MSIGWSFGLPGPFYIAGTIWQSGCRRRGYHVGTLPGWQCSHRHRSAGAARACARAEERRRAAR